MAHDARKHAIAMSIAAGAKQTEVAKQFGMTPNGICKMLQREDISALVQHYANKDHYYHRFIDRQHLVNAAEASELQHGLMMGERGELSIDQLHNITKEAIATYFRGKPQLNLHEHQHKISPQVVQQLHDSMQTLAAMRERTLPATVIDVGDDPHFLTAEQATQPLMEAVNAGTPVESDGARNPYGGSTPGPDTPTADGDS